MSNATTVRKDDVDVELVEVPMTFGGCVHGRSHDQNPFYAVSITLPGGVPVPTYTVCADCAFEIEEGE